MPLIMAHYTRNSAMTPDAKGRTSISGTLQPTEAEILATMSAYFDAPEAVAESWLRLYRADYERKAFKKGFYEGTNQVQRIVMAKQVFGR